MKKKKVASLEPPPAPLQKENVADAMLGLEVTELSDSQRAKYKLASTDAGVLVTGVKPDSAAEDRNVKVGTVLLQVGRSTVRNAVDVSEHIQEARNAGKHAILLLLERPDGHKEFKALHMSPESQNQHVATLEPPASKPDGPLVPPNSVEVGGKYRTVFSGILNPAPSPTYMTFRDTTVTREGPSESYASRFNIKSGQTLRALGAFLPETYGPKITGEEGTWIKVATPDGNEGFILANDLLSPEQYAKRKELLAEGEQLRSVLERANNSSGPLKDTAGIWTFGKSCFDPISGPLDAMNDRMALSTRWIWWTEGSTQFRANMLHPDKVYPWHFSPRNTITLNGGAGRVRLYTFKSPTIKDVDIIGFKGDRAFYHKKGNNYGIMNRCGLIEFERFSSMDLWSKYVDAEQRVADKK